MYIGEQLLDTSDERVRLSAQLGVERVIVDTNRRSEVFDPSGNWDAERIVSLRHRLNALGVDIEGMGLDGAGSVMRTLLQGGDPRPGMARLQQRLEAAARAGIGLIKYNLNYLGVVRTGVSVGRGGAEYLRFDPADASDENLAAHSYGFPDPSYAPLRLAELASSSEQRSWESIAEIVDALVDTAERVQIRLALHPHDPGFPTDGLRGFHHVLGTIEGYERVLALRNSEAHGLNLCHGSLAEMCGDPALEAPNLVRRFCETDRVYLAHFRNIRGTRDGFDEVYADNGDVDMLESLRAYRDGGYGGMLCPDHVPNSDVDPDRTRQFAFSLGYIQGLLHSLNRESSVKNEALRAGSQEEGVATL